MQEQLSEKEALKQSYESQLSTLRSRNAELEKIEKSREDFDRDYQAYKCEKENLKAAKEKITAAFNKQGEQIQLLTTELTKNKHALKYLRDVLEHHYKDGSLNSFPELVRVYQIIVSATANPPSNKPQNI